MLQHMNITNKKRKTRYIRKFRFRKNFIDEPILAFIILLLFLFSNLLIVSIVENWQYAAFVSCIIFIVQFFFLPVFQNYWTNINSKYNYKTLLYHLRNNNVVYDWRQGCFKIKGLKFISIIRYNGIWIYRKDIRMDLIHVDTWWECRQNNKINGMLTIIRDKTNKINN